MYSHFLNLFHKTNKKNDVEKMKENGSFTVK